MLRTFTSAGQRERERWVNILWLKDRKRDASIPWSWNLSLISPAEIKWADKYPTPPISYWLKLIQVPSILLVSQGSRFQVRVMTMGFKVFGKIRGRFRRSQVIPYELSIWQTKSTKQKQLQPLLCKVGNPKWRKKDNPQLDGWIQGSRCNAMISEAAQEGATSTTGASQVY